VNVTAVRFSEMTLTASDRFESVNAGEVTEDFFQLFGAHTQEGRTFAITEARPGGASVVVISDEFWTHQFRRGTAIGRTIELNRRRPLTGLPYADASEVKFNAWRSIPSTFVNVTAVRFSEMTLTASDRFESVNAGEVTEDFFQLFGAHTQEGRTFAMTEARPRLERWTR
jgi:hypothetical protein